MRNNQVMLAKKGIVARAERHGPGYVLRVESDRLLRVRDLAAVAREAQWPDTGIVLQYKKGLADLCGILWLSSGTYTPIVITHTIPLAELGR